MRLIRSLSAEGAVSWRFIALVAACFLLAASLLACNGEGSDITAEERMLELEAKAHSLEESLESLSDENATQQRELAALRQQQAAYLQEQEARGIAERSAQREAADVVAGQRERLAALEEGQARNYERLSGLEEKGELASETADALDGLGNRLEELERTAAQVEGIFPVVEKAFMVLDKRLSLLEGTAIDRTLRLVAEGGGQAQVINYGAAYGGARSAVLVLPDPLPEGEIPLIVSLHGFGGDSFFQGHYVPFHKRVNRDAFALLLPDGAENSEGKRFWNPSDGFGKARQDDMGALTALVQEAGGEFDIGPVYLFGYSNGGFMAYHMACRGLPALQAVVSLAGTSYYEDSECEGAPPVSVLHIHGTDDGVILFEGDESEPDPKGDGEPALYADAQEMVTRWAQRAGCNWPEHPVPYANRDLDQYVPGPETQAFRLDSGCAEGINIELWVGEGSGHAPGYGDALVDALLDWLLAQK